MPAFLAARTCGFVEPRCRGGEAEIRWALGALVREGSEGETARRAAREWIVVSGRGV